MIAAVFNFGPQHPSTHGVLRLISLLHGELIQWITPEIGLLHRGTEKLIECNYYISSLPYFDRFDYVSTISQELLFVHSLERLIGCVVYIYFSSWRTLFLEFYRILNHCLAITTHAIDIGLFTTMLWNFEEREKLICFCEVLSGTRFHAAFLLVGRLRYDISIRWIESFVYWLMHFVRRLKEIHNILSMNRLWRTRLYEIGLIERDFCLFFGLSGLLSRSVKIWMDARFSGYEFYHCYDYYIFLASNGDCLDRYVLRFNELVESSRMIYAIVYILIYCILYIDLNNKHNSNIRTNESNSRIDSNNRIDRYNWINRNNRNNESNSNNSSSNDNINLSYDYINDLSAEHTRSCSSRIFVMELLITEFLIQLPFILSLINELKLNIESSKGIYSIFIHSFPIISSSIVSNDYLTLNQLNKFCRYINIGDLIAILGSIDFVLGSVDLPGNVTM